MSGAGRFWHATAVATSRRSVTSGSPLEPQIGFSRAVRSGTHICVAGTAPTATQGGTLAPGDVYGQAVRCLETAEETLREAGTVLHHRREDLVLRHLDWIRRPGSTSSPGYQNALRLFCSYVSDSDYGWDRVCEQRFGTHPAQVFLEWNTAVHVQDNEQSPTKRAFTKRELQDYLDHADDQVALIAAPARKGWLPAYRDATMFWCASIPRRSGIAPDMAP